MTQHLKTSILTILLSVFALTASMAQYANHTLPQHPDEWNAKWISHPDVDKTAYGLIHFRKNFSLKAVPASCVIHVTGDNRYRLYVNGTEVGYGPQLADPRHWRYETIDIASFLKPGKNIIAAEVMNWGADRSHGIISFVTGFLIQGNSEKETFLNTTDEGNWKVLKNEAIEQITVHWRGGEKAIVGGFYAANPTDYIDASKYPWGWQKLAYDDSKWIKPAMIFSEPKTTTGYGHGWIMQPRTTEIQTNRDEKFTKIARTDLKKLPKADSPFGQKAITIPANSTHSILMDVGYETIGYPKLDLSKGKNSEVLVTYSEALYGEGNLKGNRNDLDGKVIKGIHDHYTMDGGDSRVFQPIWFRAYRFVQLDITTKDEPLLINDFYNVHSASEFPLKASFKTDNSDYDAIWDLCWKTMQLCAQDNLISDAYYEQMQYVGDLRPHLKAWTALTGDLTYFHSAMEQFNNSRLPDGNITSCYPLKATFVLPTYSLIWIDMLHDLMMQEGDKKRIEPYLGEIQEVFDYYETLIGENGLVGESEYQMFIDWYDPKEGVKSLSNKSDKSAILTLNYAYTLHNAADIMEWLGYREKAKYYRSEGTKYATVTRNLCFDAEKGIYKDNPEADFYDQRASILAVLTNAHSSAESKKLMNNILNSETHFDSHANLFYYFYLFEAMKETNQGNFTEALAPWKEMITMGMSGTPEKRLEQNPRSEVHPWTAHPLHFYFSVVAGIKPTSAGFKTVEISPNPSGLKDIKLTYPTINGAIKTDFHFDESNAISGSISLPENITGVLKWQGKEVILKGGLNSL